MQPEWIYSQGFYSGARAGGEVRIFGFYNNKQTNKKNWRILRQMDANENFGLQFLKNFDNNFNAVERSFL